MTDISNSTVGQSQNVQDVVNTSATKLDADGVFEWVTSGEVVDVANAITDLGTRAEKDAAWEQIDRPTFISEMYGAGAGGSVSADDRATIFQNVALQADGETAAAFAQDLAASGDSVEGYERLQEFSDIYAEHASPQDKLDFIDALAGDTTSGPEADALRYGLGYGGNDSYSGDAEARAVGTVLASLDGSYATEALGSLTDGQLQAVAEAGIELNGGFFNGTYSGSYDVSGYTGVAETVAQYGTNEQRAIVFSAGGGRLDAVAATPNTFDKGAAVASITESMTGVLTADTNGVMNELAYDARLDDGRALTNYAEQLIAAGDTDVLGGIQTQLMLGNTGGGDHADRFNSVNAQGIHEVAGRLGYFSGSVQNAVDNMKADADAQKAVVTDIIGTVSGLTSGAVGIAYPVAGFAVGAGGEAVKRAADALLDQPRGTVDEQIRDSVLPFDPQTNNVVRSSDAFGEFQPMIDQVENANRRTPD
ncbi:MAG: hypothetical protein AB8G16_03540 [Gammaproteobacteria bacterium]